MWAIYVLLIFLRSTEGLRGRRAAYLSGAVFLVMLGRVGRQRVEPCA